MLEVCLYMGLILLLWRQFTIVFKRWSNINIILYSWFFVVNNVWSFYDFPIPFIYFKYFTRTNWHIYWFCAFICLLWTLWIYAIVFWNGSHSYWRHLNHNILILYNSELYKLYSVDYQNEFFVRWFKRQKRFKIPKWIILHHFPYYLLCIEFYLFYQTGTIASWFGLSALVLTYPYFWVLLFYGVMVFRSIFTSNFLFSQMYFHANNTFMDGIADVNYFIFDSNYTTRIRKEIFPTTRSGYRQVGKYYNSLIRMYRVKRYYVLDNTRRYGRFLLPINWVNFKYETYDFISTTYFYKLKGRFQDYWFKRVLGWYHMKRVRRWRNTYFVRTRRSYKKSFFLLKKLDLSIIMINV